MNAALYFELIDAIAGVSDPAELSIVAERLAALPMPPLERRVLDRALRARKEALALLSQLDPAEAGAGARPAQTGTARG